MRLCSLLLLLLLSSCGYRFGTCDNFTNKSICVPYIEGDERGHFTNALIYALTTRGSFCYNESAPDYVVRVCLEAPINSTIGYRYAEGKEKEIVTSNEARVTLVANVQLVSCETGCEVGCTRRVVAAVDYDFESDFSREGEDIFSIGQLQMHSQARESSNFALAKILAEKIVDSLMYCW